ncbi:glycosyltransferase family 1 protein [Salinisphaera sp. W335]|uniref:Glycosyltransferase family 1 protein n=2 Tax=Spectribacter hydrogenoxidans TaxID=3075608 RepID=A0ABU3BYX5_9GAMM|nr:glycosyltransferase family 1 protein [Salinisphaera sp. W335]MDT0634499.1 glycosyltransferase family 1 protein [Salinisphaera sp. W335]
MSRIALMTDAWHPQVNGVVTALSALVSELHRAGDEVRVIHPGRFVTVPLPTYREIRLAAVPYPGVARRLKRWQPDAIHIATEGPCGMAAWLYCQRHGLHFTTSFHTRFPEYVHARLPFLPVSLGYRVLARFHGAADATMVSTPPLADFLRERGFSNLKQWARGVDTERFRPLASDVLANLPRPIFMSMGRVAVEKNIQAFLDLDLPGSKVVVGDGPAFQSLSRRYPEVHWLGLKLGDDLVRHLSAADCLVFPSRTDTLGLVLLEAMACGVPVAAYPVTGPSQVVDLGETGVLDEDLRAAALAALALDGDTCRRQAERWSWAASAREFRHNLVPARQSGRAAILRPQRRPG